MPATGGCGRVSIAAEPTEALVEEYARQKLADPRVQSGLRALAKESSTTTAEIVELEDRLVELERQLDEPGVPVGAIVRAMERTSQRVEELRLTPVVTDVPLLKGDWPADLARRARLVRLVVESADVGPADRSRSSEYQPERVTITPR